MRILLFLLTNAAVLLVIGLVFNVLGLGNQLHQQGINLNLEGLLVSAALMGMSGSFISLVLSKWMARRAMGVHVITHPANNTEAWLLQAVAQLSSHAGIGMPEVGIFDTPEPNAFATGMNRDNALVAVSTGLLRSMRPDEIEAVLGHEISHIANGDMVTLGLLQGVVNTFVYFFASIAGILIDRALFRSDDNRESGYGPAYYITQMIMQVLLSILASMIVMAFSRWREYRADAGGARLAGRDKMIRALQSLQHAHEQNDLPGEMAAFGISGNTQKISQLFMSHPPIEARIEALSRSSR